MTDRIKKIRKQILFDNEQSVSKALKSIKELQGLTQEEKIDLTAALSTIFYHHDHTGVTGMNRIAVRAEKQIARFGVEVIDFLIEELVNADAESAAYLGRTIAMSGSYAIERLLETWDEYETDEFAVINIVQSISYTKSAAVSKAIPRILVAAKSDNFQLRSIALYTIGQYNKRHLMT